MRKLPIPSTPFASLPDGARRDRGGEPDRRDRRSGIAAADRRRRAAIWALPFLLAAALGAEDGADPDPGDPEVIAEVRARHAGVAVLGAQREDGDFGLAVGTDSGALVFEQGDTLAFTVEVGRACHLHVFYADPEGESAMLFPNHWQRDAEVEAGTITIPAPAAGFRFPVDPPFGTMYLKAIATAEPLRLDGVDPDRLETTPFVAFGNLLTGMRNDGNDATAIHATPPRRGPRGRHLGDRRPGDPLDPAGALRPQRRRSDPRDLGRDHRRGP